MLRQFAILVIAAILISIDCVVCHADSSPYGGTAAAIPGTVQAENYDTGGSGVAYSVSSSNGNSNYYRTDGIDISYCFDNGGGYELGWTATGQWFNYTVNVASAGQYTVSIRYAAQSTVTDALYIADSLGNNLSGSVNLPSTGSQYSYATVKVYVTLPAGVQTLTVNQDNGGWYINYMSFVASCLATPPTPTGLAASATTSSATTLTWNASTAPTNCAIDNYQITMNGTPLATTSNTTYNVTGLTASTSYAFTIAAVDDYGTDSQSSPVEVTTSSAPYTPTGFTATPDDRQIVLAWNPAGGATSYNLYRSTTSGSEGLTPYLTGISGAAYTDRGLTGGTTYYYVIAAVNAGGVSSQSGEIGATPIGIPAGFAVTTGDSYAALNWDSLNGASSYVVYRGTTPGGEGATPVATVSSGTSYADCGLTNGSTYYYKIASVNANATSAQSSEASATPGAAILLTAAPGAGQVSLSWADCTAVMPVDMSPAYNVMGIYVDGVQYPYTASGSMDESGYAYSGNLLGSSVTWNGNVYKFGTAGQLDCCANTTVPLPGRQFVSIGLVGTGVEGAHANQTFTVNYMDGSSDTFSQGLSDWNHSSGYGGESNAATYAYRDVNDGYPDNTAYHLYGYTFTLNSAKVCKSITLPPNRYVVIMAMDLTPVDSVTYNVYQGTASGAESATPVQSGISGTTATVTGLNNGTTYFYEVGIVQPSATSLSSEANAMPAIVSPSAPGNLTATPGNAQVSLNWPAGTMAASYNIYRGTTSGGESATPVATGVSGTSYSDIGLTNGTTYYYLVASVNYLGTSSYSPEASATPVAPPPAPTNLAVAPSNVQVALTWTASAGASTYNVYRGISPGGESGTPVAMGISSTAYTDSGLTNGTTYYYTVAGVDTGGTGAQSLEVSATPLGTATGLQAAAGNAQVVLSWNSTAGATSYSVYRGTATGAEIGTAIVTGVSSTTYTDTGLANGTTYYYTFAAVNAGGTSAVSSEANATPNLPPSAASALLATTGNTTVSLAWSAGAGAATYNVYRGTAAGGESSTPVATGISPTSFTDTGLINGTAYYYTVAAVNGSGTSAQSSEAAAIPQPATEAHVAWNNTTGQCSLWNLDMNTGGFLALDYGPYANWTETAIADGPDGFTRVLWSNTSGQVALWCLNSFTGVFASYSFGPYPGWTATAISVATDNTTHVLWANTDGQMSIWNYNALLGTYAYSNYGPFAGWSITSIADGPDNRTRAVWTKTDGTVSIWKLNNRSGVFTQGTFGPYAGWSVKSLSVGLDNTTHVLWTNTNGTASVWNYNTTTAGFTCFDYGPYNAWSPISIADGPDGLSRLLWTKTDGTMSIWGLNDTADAFYEFTYGAYAGWTVSGVTAWP